MRIGPKHLVAVAVPAVALGVYLFWPRHKTDEAHIREAIAAIEEAVEAKELADVMEPISEQYRDGDGHAKAEVKVALLTYFLQHKTVEVMIRGLEVDVKPGGKVATARFEAVFAEGKVEAIAPGGGETIAFEVDFGKEKDGVWRIFSQRHRGR